MNHKVLKLTPTQQNIMELYQADRNVVNFDKLLLYRYWLMFDGWDEEEPTLTNLMKATPSATITRARRELHTMGLIMYSKEANKIREKRFKEELEKHSNNGFFRRILRKRGY